LLSSGLFAFSTAIDVESSTLGTLSPEERPPEGLTRLTVYGEGITTFFE
jgi:hypothetical protein